MKRERCKDLVGKQVRLLLDLETGGGTKFPAGEVLTVEDTTKGLFHLSVVDNDKPRRAIRKVQRHCFEVLDTTSQM